MISGKIAFWLGALSWVGAVSGQVAADAASPADIPRGAEVAASGGWAGPDVLEAKLDLRTILENYSKARTAFDRFRPSVWRWGSDDGRKYLVLFSQMIETILPIFDIGHKILGTGHSITRIEQLVQALHSIETYSVNVASISGALRSEPWLRPRFNAMLGSFEYLRGQVAVLLAREPTLFDLRLQLWIDRIILTHLKIGHALGGIAAVFAPRDPFDLREGRVRAELFATLNADIKHTTVLIEMLYECLGALSTTLRRDVQQLEMGVGLELAGIVGRMDLLSAIEAAISAYRQLALREGTRTAPLPADFSLYCETLRSKVAWLQYASEQKFFPLLQARTIFDHPEMDVLAEYLATSETPWMYEPALRDGLLRFVNPARLQATRAAGQAMSPFLYHARLSLRPIVERHGKLFTHIGVLAEEFAPIYQRELLGTPAEVAQVAGMSFEAGQAHPLAFTRGLGRLLQQNNRLRGHLGELLILLEIQVDIMRRSEQQLMAVPMSARLALGALITCLTQAAILSRDTLHALMMVRDRLLSLDLYNSLLQSALPLLGALQRLAAVAGDLGVAAPPEIVYPVHHEPLSRPSSPSLYQTA